MTTIEHLTKKGAWYMSDEERIWPNSRDFAPSCRKCSGVIPKTKQGWICEECQGTGADSMPWSELFRDARLK